MPMLWNLEVSRRRKLGLSLLLFPGVFVIAAALIRVIMTLEAQPSALVINRWGVRETVAGIIAVNLPILRPMLRKNFWTGGDMLSGGSKSHGTTTGTGSKSRKWTVSSISQRSRRAQPYSNFDPEDERDVGVKNKGGTVIELTDHTSEHSNASAQSRTDSEEFIIQRAQAPPRQDGVLIETSFVSSVEFCQEDFRPTVPRGLGRNDSNYVTSVSHTT